MKRSMLLLLPCLLLSVPGLALAQQQRGPDPAELMRRFQDPAAMQQMARQAQAMQACMKGIDQKKIDALQKRAEAASREIDELCTAGKKDEALARALTLGKEMRSDATVQKLQECTKDLTDMMQGMPWADLPGVKDEPDPTGSDICSEAGRGPG